VSDLKISKESTYREERWRESATSQRRLLLSAGLAYAVAMLGVSFLSSTDTSLAVISLGLLLATLALYGLTYLHDPRVRLEIVPALFAVLYGAHICLWVTYAPAEGALRAALLLSLLGLVLALMAPTRRGFMISQAIVAVLGVYGAFILWPRDLSPVPAMTFFLYWLPGIACAVAVATILENIRRQTFGLRVELARRATSDQITGVSNQAHIKLLAQNEFARARRYAEPFSAMMFEIDAYDALTKTGGLQTQDTVVQVFSGYCVIVMRHCDSFGRLSAARFLALLPETPGVGALKLASRMCTEVSALDVMVAGVPVRFAVSVGIAELHLADRSSVDLLRRAQQALDDAIERGGSQAVLAEPPSAASLLETVQEAANPPVL
jgi:diguanylate cyclase (GGDEF)-like protein